MIYFKNKLDLDHFIEDLNSKSPWFMKFNTSKASNVCWMNSKKNATYLTESIFIKLFNYEKEVKELMASSGDPKIVSNSNRKETINLLTSDNFLNLDAVIIKKVFGLMSDLLLLSGNKYKSVSPSDAFDSLPQETSSSFPDFQRPKSIIRKKVISMVHSIYRNKDAPRSFVKYPISVNWRTQISASGKLKYRQFYPFPVIIAVLEKMLFLEIFTHFERNKLTPYCMSNTHNELSLRYSKWQKYRFIYSLDFKAFDQKVENLLIHLAISFLSKKVNMSFLDNCIYQEILTYHKTCLIISSVNGITCMFRKKRGLMSGSALTNLLGSMINLFTILYLNIKFRLMIDTSSISILGDDIIFASNYKVSVDKLALLYKETFNMEVSIDKSKIFAPGEKVFFLGHYFDNNGRYLDISRTKLQLCISESYISEEILSTNDRIWSKFCSIIFKCSNGIEFFNCYKSSLLNVLKLEKPIGYYFSLFNGDGNVYKKHKFEAYKREGWRLQ